jgi:hypothetical protein
VPAAVVGGLISREARRDFDEVEAQGRYWVPLWLRPCRKACVIAGPFEGFLAEVWRLTSERRVSLFPLGDGKAAAVELEVGAVPRAR